MTHPNQASPGCSLRNFNRAGRGKWMALQTLARQIRHLKNWREVFTAYRRAEKLPALHLRNGLVLSHRECDDAWALFQEIFAERCYTKAGFYQPRSGDLVVDIGANIGFFTLHLLGHKGRPEIHCFEPNSHSRGQLEANIRTNGLDQYVTVHPLAVMDRTGPRTLTSARLAGDVSFFAAGTEPAQDFDPSGETVECVGLRDAIQRCGGRDISLLKIDVEGAEMEILAERDSAVWHRVQRVALEYHDHIRPGARALAETVLRQHFTSLRDTPVDPEGKMGILEAWR